MIAFLIWALCGVIFIGLGFYAFYAKKTVGFWANIKTIEINDEDIESYNKAVGILWCVFGVIFIILGIPLFAGQNSPFVFISVLGCILEVIFLMVAYMKIENKYRKK